LKYKANYQKREEFMPENEGCLTIFDVPVKELSSAEARIIKDAELLNIEEDIKESILYMRERIKIKI